MTFYLLEVKLLRLKCHYVFVIGAKMSSNKEQTFNFVLKLVNLLPKRFN